MMRFLLRHGAVRLIGGRAVPALMLIDLAMMANRARQVPVVDRTLRRGVGAVQRRANSVFTGRDPGPGPERDPGPARPSDVEPPHKYFSPPPR